MDPIERLAALFGKFPGIGPRQAQRFVQFLLRSSAAGRRDLAEAIEDLSGSVRQCGQCFRFFVGGGHVCVLCANPQRDTSQLAVIASDTDLLALERSGTYKGRYFVLGGTLSLASERMSGLRLKQLLDSLPERQGLREIILALPANPEGDATATRLKEELSDFAHRSSVRITTLGRGLSTGSELEYADAETLRAAIDSRR